MDFTQVTVGSNSLKYGVLLLSTSTSAVAVTTRELTTPLLLLMLLRGEIKILSGSQSIGGRPRVSLGIAMTVASVLPFFFSSRSLFSKARLKVPTVLSFNLVSIGFFLHSMFPLFLVYS